MTTTAIRTTRLAGLATALTALVACGGSPPNAGSQAQGGSADPPPSATATTTDDDTTPTADARFTETSAAPPTATERAHDPAPSTTPTPPELEAIVGRCPAVAAESHYCLTLASAGPALLGLDSGDLCPLVATDAPVSIEASSIAWLGDAVYACTDAQLLRISLRDGSWEAADLPCAAVTAYRGGLLVTGWERWEASLDWYADFAAVRRGEVGAVYPGNDWMSRFTTRGDTLVGAWHSTDTIERLDLDSGAALPPIALEEYDDWILGLALTDDDHLVLSGPNWGRVAVIFDAASGIQLRRLTLSDAAYGLACVTNVAATPVVPTRDPTRTPTPSPTACDGADCPTPTFSPAPCMPDFFATPRRGRRAAFPPSLPIASCGGGETSSNYVVEDAAGDGPELHVVTVYEGMPDPNFLNYRRGRVAVTVHARPRPVVLALSAYEPVQWDIAVDPGAVLQRIVVQGYQTPILTGIPDGVDVQTIVPGCDSAYGWELRAGGERYPELIAALRGVTGLTETSFQGCYRGDHFEVPHWLDYPPAQSPTPIAGDEMVPRAAVVFPSCSDVTSESGYCLATTDQGLALVGLESGQRCPLPTATPLGLTDATAIAWRGEFAYLCSYEAGLVRIRLTDGAMEFAEVGCAAVTDYDGGLLLLESSVPRPTAPLDEYASYADVLAGSPRREHPWVDALSGIAADDSRLYQSAFADAGVVSILDLASDAALPPLQLDGYDGPVIGIAVLDDTLLVSGWPPGLLRFDLATGARRSPLGVATGALTCVRRAPSP